MFAAVRQHAFARLKRRKEKTLADTCRMHTGGGLAFFLDDFTSAFFAIVEPSIAICRVGEGEVRLAALPAVSGLQVPRGQMQMQAEKLET